MMTKTKMDWGNQSVNIHSDAGGFIFPLILGIKFDDGGRKSELFSDEELKTVSDGRLFDLMGEEALQYFGEGWHRKIKVLLDIKFNRWLSYASGGSYLRAFGGSFTFEGLTFNYDFRYGVYASMPHDSRQWWSIDGLEIEPKDMLPHTRIKAEIMYELLQAVGNNIAKYIDFIRNSRDCYINAMNRFVTNYIQL